MTKKKDTISREELKSMLIGQEDFLKPLVQRLVQEVLEEEMDESIGASKWERTETRLSYRSGYYTRSLTTRVGKLELRVPQDRAGRFSTEVFERYQRSEKALVSCHV
jgi:putative transposase